MNKLAWSLVLLAACGDDGASDAIDAAPMIDAAPAIDAAPLPVTFALGQEFAAGTQISIADPSGAPTQLLATDADGKASATIAPGSSATIAGAQKLYVVLGLAPGDAVVLAKPHPQAQVTGKLSLVLAQLAGATSYDGTNGGAGETAGVLASGKVTVQVDAYDAYLDAGGTYTMMARALTYPTVDGFFIAKGIAPPTNGGTTIAMKQNLPWLTTLAPFAYTFTHAPESNHAELYPSIGGNRYQAQVFGGSPDGNAQVAGTIMVPADAAIDSYAAWVTFQTAHGFVERYTRIASATAPFTLDRATLPADLTDATTALATTPTVSITAAAPLADTVGTACELSYTASGGMQSVVVVMPATAAATQTSTLPALPQELAAHAPSAPYDGKLDTCRTFGGDRYDAAAFRTGGWYAATQVFDLFPPTNDQVLDFSAWYAP